MQSIAHRWAAATLLLALLALIPCQRVWSQPAPAEPPPREVMEAIEAAPAPDSPAQVVVGVTAASAICSSSIKNRCRMHSVASLPRAPCRASAGNLCDREGVSGV